MLEVKDVSLLCGYVINIFHLIFIISSIYVRVYVYTYIYIYMYMLITRNVWLFWREWAPCEKDVKKINPLFPPMKYAVHFKRRKTKRYLKIAGAKEKPTRAQHLSTFPHPGSGQQ